jgi:hypothetical protein
MHTGVANKEMKSSNVNMSEGTKLSVISYYLPFSGGKNRSIS